MKISRILLVTIGVAAACALVWKDSLAQSLTGKKAEPARVAVVDVRDLLENCQKARDLMDGLQKKRAALEMEEQKRKESIDRIEAELEQLKKDGPEYEKRFDEMEHQAIDRDVWKKFQTSLLLGEHHKLTQMLYDEICTTVAQVAREQGYTLVLYYERKMPETKTTPDFASVMDSRKVVYFDPSVDITEMVLKRMNEANKLSPVK